MAVYPSIYRAKVMQRRGPRIAAVIPQVFGDTQIEINQFFGEIPPTLRLGWVFFQGGDPEFPVWATGGHIALDTTGTDQGGGGGDQIDIVRQRTYSWSTNTTIADPGSGKVRCNAADPDDATVLAISLYDQGGQAAVTALDLRAGDEIAMYEAADISLGIRYRLLSDIVNHGYEWLEAEVEVDSDLDFDPNNNADVVIAWYVSITTGGGGGGGADEVWVGPDTPPTTAAELWYDTDEGGDLIINHWNTAWGVVGKGTFLVAHPYVINTGTSVTLASATASTVAGRRYLVRLFLNAVQALNLSVNLWVDGVQRPDGPWGNTTQNYNNLIGYWAPFENLSTGQHTFTCVVNNNGGTSGNLYMDGAHFIVEDVGPITRAAVEPAYQTPPTTVASGNPLGIVAMGSFISPIGNYAIAANSTNVRFTNYIAFTSVIGRRYRLVVQVRAIGTTTGSGINFLPHGSGIATSAADAWVNSNTPYQMAHVEAIFDGTGVADNYWVGVSSVNTVGVYLDTLSCFYIEDVGPNSTPALPVPDTPPLWTTMQLLNGWKADTQDGPAQFRKIGDVVEWRGMVQGGTNQAVIYNMPVGFRPPNTVETIAYIYTGATGVCQLYVQSSGNIYASQMTGHGVPNYISFAQVRYSVTP